jgi:hypothetical protein
MQTDTRKGLITIATIDKFVTQEEEIDTMIVKIEIGIIITEMINRIIETIIKIITLKVIKEGMMIVMMREKSIRIMAQRRLFLIRKTIKKKILLNHLLRIDLMRKMKKKEKGKEVDHRKENKVQIQIQMMT